jgi:dihydrofolate synthase/folylpolyglutamate synthase
MQAPPSEAILARLTALHPKRIDLSLGRIERLLAALGHPELRLPPVVHIAGTNGKGSTLAMLAAMVRASGRRVHRYISPHLVRFAERILLDDAPIEEARLAEALARCERANAGQPITFFEITTAAAFLAMSEVPADLVLLETGMGGRLDATNVVPRPRLVLISPISMDHEAHLGGTIAAIAGEKAGILKPGVPAIAGPQRPEAAEVLIARAQAVRAPLLLHGRDWSVRAERGAISVITPYATTRWPAPALVGVHQVENAGLAVIAAQALHELGLDAATIARGLREARWPARLQRLGRGPLPAALVAGSTLLLDGGHNPAAGEALAASLRAMADPRPLRLVVGMLRTKDAAAFLRPLAAVAEDLHAVPLGADHDGWPPEALADAARALGLPARSVASPSEAIAAIAADGRPSLVLICGSLYLAGAVLAENG